MSQRTYLRFASLLLGALLLIAATGRGATSGCPHHRPTDHAGAEPAPLPDHEICTCVDDCCGIPLLAPTGHTETCAQPSPTPRAASLTPEDETSLPGLAPFTLPLANAPPHAI